MDIKGFRNKFLFLINAVNEEVATYVQRYYPRLFLILNLPALRLYLFQPCAIKMTGN